MKKVFTLFALVLLGFYAFSQNTSPLVVKDFVMTEESLDISQIQKDARTDWDGNPVCKISIVADGFDERLMQKFVVISDGLDIMHKSIKNGEMILLVSSNKNGQIIVKYMGDCVFTLPNKLDGTKCYKLTVGLAAAQLVIDASPAEAEVFVDNVLAGKGRVSIDVTIGMGHSYRVVCDDYFPVDGVVEFLNKDKKEIKVNLDPSFGWITVNSKPSAADVIVDGKRLGKTPLDKAKIKRGTHRVELKKTGYVSVVKLVKIQAGETNMELDSVVLEAKEVRFGGLTIESTPEGADITIDGVKIGTSPMTLGGLIIGNHSVKLEMYGYFPVTENVMIIENDTTSLNVGLLKGQEVTIESNIVGDKIFVDAKYLGMSPVQTILTNGPHDLTVVRGGSSNDLVELLKEKDIHYNRKMFNVSSLNPVSIENVEIPIYDRIFTVNGVTFDMVAVDGGSKASFNIGRYEVTQALWNAVMGELPTMPYYDDNLPVSNVSWYDAVEFCNILSEKCGLQKYYNIDKTGEEWQVTINTDADGFCLPTVEEWKYAAKGGKKSKGYKYSGGDYITNVAWFDQNSGDRFLYEEEVDYGDSKNLNRYFKRLDKIHKLLENNKCRTRIVGQRDSNELGLYDMTGNVNEWCYDTNDKKPLCGGCYNSSKSYCEVDDCEKHYSPDSDYSSNGLRIILKY